MATPGSRQKVLCLYKTILRTAQGWEAASGKYKDTAEEREYIQMEAKSLFRRNKPITDPTEVDTCIKEAESRLEIALHYKSPYPRPMNVPSMGLTPTLSRGKKAQERLRKRSKPVYLHSQDNT